jgi:tellurite resistance protein TerC
VPAVLAVSHEQFIVFSSNAFAILGLRALYFLLADMHARFTYLQQGLAIILAFVGVKMIIAEWYHIPTWLSLLVIALILTASIGFSLKSERGLDEQRPDWDKAQHDAEWADVNEFTSGDTVPRARDEH